MRLVTSLHDGVTSGSCWDSGAAATVFDGASSYVPRSQVARPIVAAWESWQTSTDNPLPAGPDTQRDINFAGVGAGAGIGFILWCLVLVSSCGDVECDESDSVLRS